MASVTGVVQKGPFQTLQLQAQPLAANGLPQGAPVQGQHLGEGAYQVNLALGGTYQLQATGLFQDELSGELVALSVPLTALVQVNGPTEKNLNLATHFAGQQVLGEVREGLATLSATTIRDGERRVAAQLGFANGTDPGVLNLARVPANAGLSDPDLHLALLSAAFMALPRASGQMPEVYPGLTDLLGKGLSPEDFKDAFAVLNGLGVLELAEKLQARGALPNSLGLPGEERGFSCGPEVCGFIGPPGISVAGTTAYEGRGVAEIVVRRTGSAAADQTVRLQALALDPVSAEPHRDFITVDRVLRFPPGATELRVGVPLILDQLDEPLERFRVRLSEPTGGASITAAEARVGVLDGLPPGLEPANVALQIARLCLIGVGDAREPLGDGCTVPGTDQQPLLEGVPNVLKMAVVLQTDCAVAQNCPARSRDWQVDLDLVAQRNGAELSRFSLGAFAYAGADVQLAGVSLPEAPAVHVRLEDPAIRAALLAAIADGAALTVAARLQALPSPPTATAALPSLLPLASTVTFGDRVLPLLPRDVSLQPDGSCAAPGLRLMGRLLPVELGMSDSPFSVANVETATDEQTVPGTLCVRLEGDRLIATQADLAIEGVAVWRLPSRQGTRLASLFDAVLPGLLVSGAAGGGHYVSEGLPFQWRVGAARLTENGLTVRLEAPETLQVGRGISPADPRNLVRPERAEAFASNDALFGLPFGTVEAAVSAEMGISAPIGFGAGAASLAYPRTRLQWQGFQTSVVAGRLAGAVSVDLSIEMSQNADCEAADCASGSQRRYRAGGSLKLDGAGHGLGQLAITQAAATSSPGFGARNGGALAIERPGDLPEGAAVAFAFAGFRLSASQPAVGQLPGHLEDGAAALTLHGTGSAAYRRGNFAPSGLTVGPTLYADAQGQPQVGAGRDLSGLPLKLDTGEALTQLAASLGTKYVLRPAGFTGVFNARSEALAGPISYAGFPLSFSRFAFRAVENRIEAETWIDGRFAIPGDAGIDNLVFASLGLDCAARFGQGRLVTETCDGTDSNGNGVVDENCPTVLAAWAFPTTVQSFRFGRADGAENPPSCAVEPQVAVLGQSVRPLALDRPIAMEIGWRGNGSIAFQQARGLGAYRLDETPENRGFGVQLASATLKTRASGETRGWMEGETRVAVPFWQALDAEARLENRVFLGAPEARPSLLVPPGAFLPADAALDNAALGPQLATDPRFRFGLRYEWGRTGFNFNFPGAVYFEPAGFNRSPGFLGVRKEKDLIVFDVGAGVDYIEPERTKMSFGASADFERLRGIRFQVSLEDAASLEKVDALLLRGRIVHAPVLAPTFTTVQERLFFLNRFANEGLDRLLEAALLRAVTEAGVALGTVSPLGEDPFVSLARGITQLRALPELVDNQIDASLRQPLNEGLDAADAAIRNRYLGFRAGLPTVPAATLTARVKAELIAVAEEVDAAAGEISRLATALDPRIAELEGLLDEATAAASRAENALAEIDSVLDASTRFANAACSDTSALAGEASGYLRPVFEHLDNTAALLETVQGAALLLPIIEIVAADSPELVSGLRSGQEAITRTADDLLERLRAAETRLKAGACSADLQDLLRQASLFTGRLRTEVGQVAGVARALKAQLAQARALRDELLAEILMPLGVVSGALREGAEQIETLNNLADANRALDRVEQRIVQALNDADLPPFDGVAHLVRPASSTQLDVLIALRNALDEQIRRHFDQPLAVVRAAVQERLPGANYTPDELRRLLVGLIMDSGPVKDLRRAANQQLVEIHRQVNTLFLQVTDQVNTAVKGALAKVEGEVNALLAEATAPLKSIPLNGAKLDGYAVIAATELERVHVAAEFTIPGTDGEDPKTFGAAFEAVSWNANGKNEGCSVAGDAASNLDVTLSAFNLPARFGTTELLMKKIYMGFTLDQGGGGLRPIGVFGGLQTQGEIGFTEFIIYDPGFAAGFGTREIYLGARAGAVFSDISAEVAFLAGRTCNKAILEELDPFVGQFIPLPDAGFFGVYARGAATIPIIPGSCALSVSAAADFGGWLLAGPPVTLGGLVGGGAIGRIGCVAAIRGQVRALGQVNTQGDLLFVGEGFVVGGVGLCEPPTWTTVERSRQDSFCATFDALIRVRYQRGWSILDLSAGGPF